jgi:hypothetical protein
VDEVLVVEQLQLPVLICLVPPLPLVQQVLELEA